MSVVATSTAVPVPVSLRGVSDVIPLLCDALVATLTGPDRIETVTGIPEEEEGRECKNVSVNWKSATSLKEPPLG
jgi:hypothetical protein